MTKWSVEKIGDIKEEQFSMDEVMRQVGSVVGILRDSMGERLEKFGGSLKGPEKLLRIRSQRSLQAKMVMGLPGPTHDFT